MARFSRLKEAWGILRRAPGLGDTGSPAPKRRLNRIERMRARIGWERTPQFLETGSVLRLASATFNSKAMEVVDKDIEERLNRLNRLNRSSCR
jgi:hypothetical protein